MYRFHIITLGCRVNQYESRAIAEKLTGMGLVESEDGYGCDLCVINTCAVTAESGRKSRQMIRRAAQRSPNAVIAAVGCWTQSAAQEALDLGCVDIVMGSADKQKLCETAVAMIGKRKGSYSSAANILPLDKYDEYSRSKPGSVREYVKIEDGCNGKCAYCIIPSVRGPVRSRGADDVLRECEALCRNGAKELIFTGIELSGYQYGLTSLLRAASATPGLERMRLGSLDPAMVTERFVGEIRDIDKIMPHFHLSIQSGCSATLAAMRRKYNADTAMKAVELLRSAFPGVMLTCDVIVGFPGETDEDFRETSDFMKRAGFLHAHIFPYSKRPGTVAAGMSRQIPKSVKEARLHALEDIQDSVSENIFSGIIRSGKALNVLVETCKDGVCCGHSEEFIPVSFIGNEKMTGKIISVVPDRYCKGEMFG